MLEPNYEFIKTLSKIPGISYAEDRQWHELNLEIDNSPFMKYNCSCLKRKTKKEKNLEIILKPYAWSVDNSIYTYYIGQCPRCEIIYYVGQEEK